jgi:hypothetical protein
VSPSRASDLLVVAVTLFAVLAILPIGDVATYALSTLTVTLIAWPIGVLVWLARRWARAADVRFVVLTVVLAAAATGSAIVAIALSR